MSDITWRYGRCPCCFKKTEIVIGIMCNETARGWENIHSPAAAQELAKRGVCPWCGRETTIVAKTLLSRFEPTQRATNRELCW